MHKKDVLSLPRKLLSPYKRAAIRAAKRILPKKKQLLFVFGGRTQYWPGMGSDLYKNEPVFRNTIRECDAIIHELSGISILPNFEAPANEKLFEDESFIVYIITSIQVALYELWKSKGIVPNAVIGVSLGEVTAVYAAGGMSLCDTLQVIVNCAAIHKLEQRDYLPLYLQCSLADARALAKASPLFLEPIYEAGEQGVLALCHKDEKEAAGKLLNDKGISWSAPHRETIWPYHTRLILQYRDALTKYRTPVEPLPLRCDYYSCVTGGCIPANSLVESSYWFDLKHRPVLLHAALSAVSHAGFEVMLNAGPYAFQRSQLSRSAQVNNIVMLDSIRKGEDETDVFNVTQKRIASYKLRKPAPQQDFIDQFSLHNPVVQKDPDPYFRHLQKQGTVHFLPAQNEWIVLDYDTIEQVLKQPEIFSSSLHRTFDECLVGNDPPSHTLVRNLLQPLFSQPVLNSLGEFTVQYSNTLLNRLEGAGRFNAVEAFSLPLAQGVVAKFLGLSEEDHTALKKCLNGHVYAMGFLDNMKQFFTEYLHAQEKVMANNAAGLLLTQIKDNKLSFDQAVSLMRLLWVAGMTTTSMLLSTAIHLMAKDAALQDKLRESDQLINKFIEECLRLEAPETDLKRITTREVVLQGKTIPAGAVVMLCLRTANRDAAHFENPDEISFDRPAKKHFAFGGGYHYCLGVGMARLEAKYAVKAILEHLPKLKLDESCAPAYFPSPHFRGLKELIIYNDK